MKNDISISIDPTKLKRATVRALHQHHILIFTVIVLGGLSAATYVLYQTAISSQTTDTAATRTTFDAATIEKIRGLNADPNASVNPSLPEGRINPFQE